MSAQPGFCISLHQFSGGCWLVSCANMWGWSLRDPEEMVWSITPGSNPMALHYRSRGWVLWVLTWLLSCFPSTFQCDPPALTAGALWVQTAVELSCLQNENFYLKHHRIPAQSPVSYPLLYLGSSVGKDKIRFRFVEK